MKTEDADHEIQNLMINLKNDDAKVRRIAAYKLSKKGNPSTVTALIEATKDTDAIVCLNAKNALFAIGSEDAIEYLNSIHATPPKTPTSPLLFFTTPLLILCYWMTIKYSVNLSLSEESQSLVVAIRWLAVVAISFSSILFLRAFRNKNSASYWGMISTAIGISTSYFLISMIMYQKQGLYDENDISLAVGTLFYYFLLCLFILPTSAMVVKTQQRDVWWWIGMILNIPIFLILMIILFPLINY